MRVQCDVCEKNLAAVMCCADEAALCTQCDMRVHAANKLANKHQRVQLLAPNTEKPTCDICQEKSAFFFCLEDRALLCRDCDVSIHLPNSLSASHRRFLMTGTRVALEAVPNDSPSDSGLEEAQAVPGEIGGPCIEGAMTGTSRMDQNLGGGGLYNDLTSTSIPLRGGHGGAQQPAMMFGGGSSAMMSQGRSSLATGGASGFGRKNSFSDLTMDTVPGWRVDEFLNIPELADGYTLADIGSSKAEVEVASLGDFDWTADLSLFDEQVYAESLHEVPSLPQLIGAPSSSRVQSTLKNRTRHDNAAVVPDYDDAFVVPDLGLESSPPAPKRRRNYL